MGLFDFIKNVGRNTENENLENGLRDAINKAQLNIHNFQIKLDHGVATLTGVAATQKDLELARLIVGNHKGVEKVNDDGLQLAPPPQAQASAPVAAAPAYAPAKMVTVKSGDTLSKIAAQYLGNANRYPEIFEANRPMLKDPDEIFPGQVLRIPTESAASAPH